MSVRSALLSPAIGRCAFWGMLCCALVGSTKAEPGSIDFNFYPVLTKVNVDSTYTVNVYQKLPNRWHYFSLNNFINTDARRELSDRFKFYSEHSFRWKVAEDSAWDLTTQLNLRSGHESERLRFGARLRLNDTRVMKDFFESIHLNYSLNFHVVQLDHEPAKVWQMEHAFRKVFPDVSDRIYLAGFVDHTFNEDLPAGFPSAPVVGEVQFGLRLVENWYAIVEYRINEYRRGNTKNLALGAEYTYKW